MRSRVSALLSLFVVSVVAVRPGCAQAFSNWSTPVNITQLNTSGFEG